MPFYPVKKIQIKKTKEYINFSSAELNVDSSGGTSYWNVHLTTESPETYFEHAITNKEQPQLIFFTEEGQRYEGTVLVSNKSMGENGGLIELIGKGELKSIN